MAAEGQYTRRRGRTAAHTTQREGGGRSKPAQARKNKSRDRMTIRAFYRLSVLLETGSPFREQRPDLWLRIELSSLGGERLHSILVNTALSVQA